MKDKLKKKKKRTKEENEKLAGERRCPPEPRPQ